MKRKATPRLRQLVSDHAVVRYLEREYGLDIDSIRKEIIGSHEPTIKNMTNGKINLREKGTSLVVRDGTVVTYME